MPVLFIKVTATGSHNQVFDSRIMILFLLFSYPFSPFFAYILFLYLIQIGRKVMSAFVQR